MSILFIILFLILISLSEEEEKEEIPLFLKSYKEDAEPQYYHPVTGYKGTKAEMDAYIINREKKCLDNL